MKFEFGSSVFNFSRQEVDSVLITTLKRLDMQRLQNRQPVVYEMGTSWKSIVATFDMNNTPMTWEKLDQLRQVTDIVTITMYYRGGTTQAETFDVRIDPVMPMYFYGGHVDRATPVVMRMYEAAAG